MDQLFGLLLLGLGIKNPVTPAILGEQDELRTGNNTVVREIRKELMEDRREAMVVAREKFREEMKTRREEAREAFQEEREAFKEKLKTLRDKKKKEILVRVDAKMAELLKKRTDTMSRHLDKMTEILQKVIDRAAKARENGKDTTSVEVAIATAQSAIVAAQNAVALIAGNEYVVNITSELSLASDVGATRRQLSTDFRATHDTLVVARKAVSEAIRAMATVVGEKAPQAVTEKV